MRFAIRELAANYAARPSAVSLRTVAVVRVGGSLLLFFFFISCLLCALRLSSRMNDTPALCIITFSSSVLAAEAVAFSGRRRRRLPFLSPSLPPSQTLLPGILAWGVAGEARAWAPCHHHRQRSSYTDLDCSLPLLIGH